MAQRQFTVVPDDDPPEHAQPAAKPPADPVHLQMLLLALASLSKRVFIAILDAFALIVVVLAFWLWFKIPDPSVQQVVSLSIFSLFGLAAIALVRWKR